MAKQETNYIRQIINLHLKRWCKANPSFDVRVVKVAVDKLVTLTQQEWTHMAAGVGVDGVGLIARDFAQQTPALLERVGLKGVAFAPLSTVVPSFDTEKGLVYGLSDAEKATQVDEGIRWALLKDEIKAEQAARLAAQVAEYREEHKDALEEMALLHQEKARREQEDKELEIERLRQEALEVQRIQEGPKGPSTQELLEGLLGQGWPDPEDQIGWRRLIASMALLLPEGVRAEKTKAVEGFHETLTDCGAGYYAGHWLGASLKSAVWRWAGALVWAGISQKDQAPVLLDAAGDVFALLHLWFGMAEEGARMWEDQVPSEMELDALNSVVHGVEGQKARRTEPGTPIPLVWNSVEAQLGRVKEFQKKRAQEASNRLGAFAAQLGVKL